MQKNVEWPIIKSYTYLKSTISNWIEMSKKKKVGGESRCETGIHSYNPPIRSTYWKTHVSI